MILPLLLMLALAPLNAQTRAPEGRVSKQTMTSNSARRTYHLYVPASLKETKRSAPLVIVLHGSGGAASQMVESWRDLAEREGFIVAGPSALDSSRWQTPKDGPDFLAEMTEEIKTKHPVDARRVYLFGHSGGSGFAINMSLLESEYFAAAAVHASATFREQYLDVAARKTPFAIFAGTDDEVFPLREVRAAVRKLEERGFPVRFVTYAGHGHDYRLRSTEINRDAWEFLKERALASDPVFVKHQFKN